MRWGKWFRGLSRDDGVTAIEYGLLVALLSLAALVLAGPISQGLTQRFADSTQGPGITACAAGDTGCNAYGQLQVANLPGNSGLSLQDYGPIIATVGAPVFRAASVAGGSTPYSFSVSGTLPTGLTLNASTGAITGTPTATSPERTFSVTVVDAGGRTAVASVKITISAAPTSCQLSGYANITGTIGQPISEQVPSTAGCTGSVVFSVTPALPAGLNLASGDGLLSGTPQAASSGTYAITATDGLGSTDTRTITVTITAAPVCTIGGYSNITATLNRPITTQTPTTSNCTAPMTWSITPGLPRGLTLSPTTGSLTGSPSRESGLTTYTIAAQDSSSPRQTATTSMTIVVLSPCTDLGTFSNKKITGLPFDQTIGNWPAGATMGSLTPDGSSAGTVVVKSAGTGTVTWSGATSGSTWTGTYTYTSTGCAGTGTGGLSFEWKK